MPSRRLPSDIQSFLSSSLTHSTPRNNPISSTPVLDFYRNALPASPSRLFVDDLHRSLRGNYEELESNHSFIQWLFPLRTPGVNPQAPLLQAHEISRLREDESVQTRYRTSYEIMLDFYGFRFKDWTTGELTRKEGPGYKARFANLMRNGHNWLRISRILKSNSEFGLERLNAPFLLYVLVEQSRPRRHSDPSLAPQLDSPGLVRSMDDYWRHCIRDDQERNWVVETIDRVRQGQREWTQSDYDEALRRRKVMGSFDEEVPNNLKDRDGKIKN